MKKTHLAFAVAGAVSLGATVAHAADFNTSATLQNTLAVTNLQDFDLGSVFATVTSGGDDGAGTPTDYVGVGAMTISPLGAVTYPGDSISVNLTSLAAPTPAQGSVDMAAQFTLTLPNTDTVATTDFVGGDANLVTAYGLADGVTELIHDSGNPSVPSLFLMHFRISSVSGGTTPVTAAGDDDGVFLITPEFGETTYVFNIGATVTTEPKDFDVDSDYPMTYQQGTYSGTFEVTAAY